MDYIQLVIEEANRRVPEFPLDYKKQSIFLRSTVNLLVVDVINDLEQQGVIPAKFAKRAVQAVSWQNDNDNVLSFWRLQDMFARERAERRNKRPSIGTLKYYVVDNRYDSEKRVALRVRHASQAKHIDPQYYKVVKTKYRVVKLTNQQKDTLLDKMEQKLHASAYADTFRNKVFNRVYNEEYRIPQNRLDEKVERLACIYQEVRNHILIKKPINASMTVSQPWIEIANVIGEKVV